MVRARVIFALLVLVVSSPFCLAQSDAERTERWQNDWQAFGEAIAPYTRRGYIEPPLGLRSGYAEFNRLFARPVRWTGRVRSMSGSGITLTMEPIEIPLRDGTTVTVSELMLYCWDECEPWRALSPGARVIFQTRLVNRTRGIQPVVRVRRSGSDTRIFFETFGAELVAALPGDGQDTR